MENKEEQLLDACYEGEVDDVKDLLEYKEINVNVQENEDKGKTPLILACENGYLEIVELLLKDKRVDVNLRNEDQSAFYYACSDGRIEIVKLLLSNKKVDINSETNRGFTPLMEACRKGQFEVVELILQSDRKIDLNAQNLDEKTAIDIARDYGYLNIVELLEFHNLERKQSIFFFFFFFSFQRK